MLAGVSFAVAKCIGGRLDADAVIYHVELVLEPPSMYECIIMYICRFVSEGRRG
jgi:hypothetical protein